MRVSFFESRRLRDGAPHQTPRIILNADDFGSSPAVNAAVLRAHSEGVLTSASLMVAGQAAAEAVEIARLNPLLAVGLHLVVSNGPAVLPHGAIPHLVDGRGGFPKGPFRLGLRYALIPAVKRELAAEIAAQFERFAATGLRLSHIDGHENMHLHPEVLRIVLPLAERHGASGLRLPRGELLLSLRHDRHRAAVKVAWSTAYAILSRRAQPRISGRGLVASRRVFGLMESGGMDEAYLLHVLERLRSPSAEIYFHPSAGPRDEALGPNPADLAALVSPAVASAIRSRGMLLTTYPGLAGRIPDR